MSCRIDFRLSYTDASWEIDPKDEETSQNGLQEITQLSYKIYYKLEHTGISGTILLHGWSISMRISQIRTNISRLYLGLHTDVL